MSFFYRFIAGAMDLKNFVHPAAGKMTPYTAVFIFSVGIFISNFAVQYPADEKAHRRAACKLQAILCN